MNQQCISLDGYVDRTPIEEQLVLSFKARSRQDQIFRRVGKNQTYGIVSLRVIVLSRFDLEKICTLLVPPGRTFT